MTLSREVSTLVSASFSSHGCRLPGCLIAIAFVLSGLRISELSRLELQSESRISALLGTWVGRKVPDIGSGSQGHQIAFLSKCNSSNDFGGHVLGCHKPLLLTLEDGVDSVLEFQPLDEMGLPEGGETPLSNFPVVVPRQVDIAGVEFMVDYFSLKLLRGVAEFPKNSEQLLASVGG